MSDLSPTNASAEAADHLARLNGALGLQAAILALLLPPDAPRALRVWEAETAGTPTAGALRAHVANLPGAARLPWFETLVSRLRGQPLAARQDLLEATRRLMAAGGTVRPLDRLHWLAMRQRLGGRPLARTHPGAAADLPALPQAAVDAIAAYTAYLARMVPLDAATGAQGGSAGAAWYEDVMQAWRAHAAVPPCHAPDADGLVHALGEIQALPWMQRPLLGRAWVTAALRHGHPARLGDSAADALRLTCALLDSPLPPELARQFDASVPDEAPR